MIYRTAPYSATLNDPYTDFKVTPLLDAEYLRNGTRYWQFLWNTNRDLHTLLNSISSNDLEWFSKIFNDTKRRAVSATAELLVFCFLIFTNEMTLYLSSTYLGLIETLARWTLASLVDCHTMLLVDYYIFVMFSVYGKINMMMIPLWVELKLNEMELQFK